MLILGVDTSGKNGSIALVEFGQGSPHTLEIVPLEGGTFSAQLVPQISAALSRHNFTKHAIGGFAAVSGPGSFTGLRVGLAAIKALAEVLHKPIASVPLLEAVARAAGKRGEIIAALDAGRGEVYIAEFSLAENTATAREQDLIPLEQLAASVHGREIVTPDAKIAEFSRGHGARVQQIEYPRADFIAVLGFEKIKAGEVISVEALDANYIRRSDAEIKRFTGQ